MREKLLGALRSMSGQHVMVDVVGALRCSQGFDFFEVWQEDEEVCLSSTDTEFRFDVDLDYIRNVEVLECGLTQVDIELEDGTWVQIYNC